MRPLPHARNLRLAERCFYTGTAAVMLVVVFLGFARTFFLKAWFPDAAVLAPPEPFFFYVHGVCSSAWIVLMLVQPALIAGRRTDLHRTVGWFGAGLAVAVIAVGAVGALMAATRPGGFMGVPAPPLQFLAIPVADLVLFAIFIVAAVMWRRDTQSHKRLMLLATIGLLDAAVVRWPFADMTTELAGRWWTMTDLGVDLFLVPMVVWDIVSRGHVHRVTLVGALIVIASQPLRIVLSETQVWLAFAEWAVGLLG